MRKRLVAHFPDYGQIRTAPGWGNTWLPDRILHLDRAQLELGADLVLRECTTFVVNTAFEVQLLNAKLFLQLSQ